MGEEFYTTVTSIEKPSVVYNITNNDGTYIVAQSDCYINTPYLDSTSSEIVIPQNINNCVLKFTVDTEPPTLNIHSSYKFNNTPDWTEEGATYLVCIDHGVIVWNKLV